MDRGGGKAWSWRGERRSSSWRPKIFYNKVVALAVMWCQTSTVLAWSILLLHISLVSPWYLPGFPGVRLVLYWHGLYFYYLPGVRHSTIILISQEVVVSYYVEFFDSERQSQNERQSQKPLSISLASDVVYYLAGPSSNVTISYSRSLRLLSCGLGHIIITSVIFHMLQMV